MGFRGVLSWTSSPSLRDEISAEIGDDQVVSHVRFQRLGLQGFDLLDRHPARERMEAARASSCFVMRAASASDPERMAGCGVQRLRALRIFIVGGAGRMVTPSTGL